MLTIHTEVQSHTGVARLMLKEGTLPNEIDLVAVDQCGRALDGGWILTISPRGIERLGGVSPNLGIATDDGDGGFVRKVVEVVRPG